LRIGDTPWRLVTILDEGFKKIPDPIWKGIEDIRLFWDPATFKIRGLGTTYEYSTDNHGTIILLDVDLDTATITPMSLLPRRQDCEKNHSPILGTNLVVYGWWPAISVYDIREPGKFTHENREVPLIFNKMRGSTVGVPYPSRDTPVSYWFITHTKSDNAPWVFTSYIVILKAETFEVQSYSLPFFFENSHIEFTTGFTFVDDDSAMLIGYSVLDKSSAMMKLPISRVREMLIPVTTVHV
jgi:hypothetical protein